MALMKFNDVYPDRQATFGNGQNIADFGEYSVYARRDDKVGTIEDALFDNSTCHICYLIVDTGFWIFGKKVLLPIGLAHFDYDQKRVYVDGLTQEQVESLPNYDSNMTIDNDYEERVRTSYRTLGENRTRQFMGKEYNVDKYRAYPGSAALHGVTEHPGGAAAAGALDAYAREPGLYGMDADAHQAISLYQERLIADKDRFKSGTVSLGKRVETETQKVSVPVENERVVIERTTPSNPRPVDGMPDFREGEVARVEIYGETADIRKEAYVREEVSVRKEVDRETVTGKETLRREELEVKKQGDPAINTK